MRDLYLAEGCTELPHEEAVRHRVEIARMALYPLDYFDAFLSNSQILEVDGEGELLMSATVEALTKYGYQA